MYHWKLYSVVSCLCPLNDCISTLTLMLREMCTILVKTSFHMHMQKGTFLAPEGRVFPPPKHLEEQILQFSLSSLIVHPQLTFQSNFVQKV